VIILQFRTKLIRLIYTWFLCGATPASYPRFRLIENRTNVASYLVEVAMTNETTSATSYDLISQYRIIYLAWMSRQ